jgi:hypothetical protein
MIIRRQLILPTLAVVLAAGGNSLMAQVTTGSLSGTVTDISGNPLKNVRVTLESPALFTPRAYTTGADGEYRAMLLPVGTYTVKVNAEGMLGKTATGVRVGVGTNLTLSFALKATTSSATTVEVVGNMAAEAKTDDKVSVNYSAEKLLQMPTSGAGPSFQAALSIAPGVTGSYDAASTKIRGGDLNQVMYRIDGINVKDDSGGGALYQPLPDSVEDIQVVLTALNARFGSVSGGQVNVVTKSGSNEFAATIRNTISRPSWKADYKQASGSYNATTRTENYDQYTDLTASGPIIKDKLWFYVGTRFQPSRQKTTELTYSATGLELDASGAQTGTQVPWDTLKNQIVCKNTFGLIPNVDATVSAGPGGGYAVNLFEAGNYVQGSVDYKKYEGKITGAITDSHMLSLTYLFEQTDEGASSGERNTGTQANLLRAAQLGTVTTKTHGWTLNYNGTLAPNWTIEARASGALRSQGDVPREAGYEAGPSIWLNWQSPRSTLLLHGNDGTNGDVYFWGTAGDIHHMSTYNTDQKRGNNSYSVNITTYQDFVGKHQIDFGGERVQTIYNFGRGRPGAGYMAVDTGGEYVNTSGDVLFPVFHRMPLADGSYPWILSQGAGNHAAGAVADPGAPWNGATWQLNGDKYTLWWQQRNGPSAFLESNWAHSMDEKNHTDAFYVNDSWTINPKWNAMLGYRYSKMYLQNVGRDISSISVSEPRAMIKYNPDGQNQRIISLSFAKLSQAYSDQIANYFRSNEWSMNTQSPWTGAALDIVQPGIDSPEAATDAPNGLHNGYNYTGANMYGVRFVDYATLTNPENYAKRGSGDIINSADQNVTEGLRAPYALEWNLGFQRNYAKGYFKLNLVQRTYKGSIQGHPWTGLFDYGANSWVILTSPNPEDPNYKQITQKAYFPNAEKDQIYRNVEFSFERAVSTRWSVSGNFTYERTTGVNQEEYEKMKGLRNALLGYNEAVTPDEILSNNKFGYLAITYIQPVGKGNISFAAKVNYNNNNGYTTPYSALNYMDLPGFAAYAQANLPDTLPNAATGGTIAWNSSWNEGRGAKRSNMYYRVYTGAAGQYRNAWDTYSVDSVINADVPLHGKLHLIGRLQVNNVFNNMLMTNMYTAFSGGVNNGVAGGGSGDARVSGRMYQTFNANRVYGQGANAYIAGQGYQDYNYGNGGRSFSNVSVGLKF